MVPLTFFKNTLRRLGIGKITRWIDVMAEKLEISKAYFMLSVTRKPVLKVKDNSTGMAKLAVYYRISDNSNPTKVKLPSATKEHCLENCIKGFLEQSRAFNIDANAVGEGTWEFVKMLSQKYKKINIERTDYSNSAESLVHVFKRALKELPIGSPVYFAEDDYLYLPNSYKILMEGLTKADYVTLYDHPDMYIANPGVHPEISGGGENTKVFLTASSHWKCTNSTTHTFATTTDILLGDKKVFYKFISLSSFLLSDYEAFVYLSKKDHRLPHTGAFNTLRNQVFSAIHRLE